MSAALLRPRRSHARRRHAVSTVAAALATAAAVALAAAGSSLGGPASESCGFALTAAAGHGPRAQRPDGRRSSAPQRGSLAGPAPAACLGARAWRWTGGAAAALALGLAGAGLRSAWSRPPSSSASAPGRVAVAAYSPGSVQEAWDNHFEAFGKQDVEQILLDYDESSVLRVYDHTSETKTVYKGLDGIREFFTGLFGDMSDLSTLAAPVIDVDEVGGKGGQVFLIWKCPGCGFKSGTDTFIFGSDLKIKFQNVVWTKGS